MSRRNLFSWAGLSLAAFALICGLDPGGALAAPPITAPGTTPDYYETPNWANSPPLRKFVDRVPGLCGTANGTNALGQCIPVAVKDTTTYPGSEYYEIALVEYRERLHSDFDPLDNTDKRAATSGGTKLRGYVQEVN